LSARLSSFGGLLRPTPTLVLRLIAPVERIITDHPGARGALFIAFSALSAMVAFFFGCHHPGRRETGGSEHASV
jgi:hypothetical protein